MSFAFWFLYLDVINNIGTYAPVVNLAQLQSEMHTIYY
jgi:hypothetical protein